MFAKAALALAALAPGVIADGHLDDDIVLRVTNLSFLQPFGGFAVITHNDEVPPLFTLGSKSSDELARLAEDGNPTPLVDFYNGLDSGVGTAFAFSTGAPFSGGDSLEITIPRDPAYPLVSVTTMAINTNDCFVAINGVELEVGQVFTGVGYDSGTEENNENCNSIPGPACALRDANNFADGNGEGFVHVHRGFHGIGLIDDPPLRADRYDWRNPMVRWEVKEAPECQVEFILWDADADVPLRPVEPIEYVKDNQFNIQARPTAECDTTLSAKMMLDGPITGFEYRPERKGPYMHFGDDAKGDIFGQDYKVGTYKISSDIYAGKRFTGGIVVSGSMEFEIVDGSP